MLTVIVAACGSTPPPSSQPTTETEAPQDESFGMMDLARETLCRSDPDDCPEWELTEDDPHYRSSAGTTPEATVGGSLGLESLGLDELPPIPRDTRTWQVREGTPDVRGSYDPRNVAVIMRQRLTQIGRCYESALGESPGLAAEVRITFTLTSSGSTDAIEIAGALPTEMKACITRVMQDVKFPPPGPDAVDVTYPLAFAPAKSSPPPQAPPSVD